MPLFFNFYKQQILYFFMTIPSNNSGYIQQAIPDLPDLYDTSPKAKKESDNITEMLANILNEQMNPNKQMNSSIKKPLKERVDCNIQDEEGCTPLIQAAFENNVSSVKSLLLEGAKIELQNNAGDTALHFAVYHQNLELAESLLESPSKKDFIDLADKNGRTALHLATLSQNLDFVNLLLENDANVNLSDKEGITPLFIAYQQSNFEIFKKLLIKSNRDTVDRFYLEDPKNQKRVTLLFSAAVRGKIKFVSALVKRGANVNKLNESFQMTPFMAACSQGNVNLVKRFLAKDSKNEWLSCLGECERKALNYTIDSGNPQVVEMLLKAGANIMDHQYLGYTPLMQAVINGNKEIVETILNYDRDYQCLNYQLMGKTALEMAHIRKTESKDAKKTLNYQQIIQVLTKAQANYVASLPSNNLQHPSNNYGLLN